MRKRTSDPRATLAVVGKRVLILELCTSEGSQPFSREGLRTLLRLETGASSSHINFVSLCATLRITSPCSSCDTHLADKLWDTWCKTQTWCTRTIQLSAAVAKRKQGIIYFCRLKNKNKNPNNLVQQQKVDKCIFCGLIKLCNYSNES